LTSSFTTVHEPKPLPFNPAKLDGISEKLIRSHWENNYSGAVKALNTVKQRLVAALDDANTPPYVYNDLSACLKSFDNWPEPACLALG